MRPLFATKPNFRMRLLPRVCYYTILFIWSLENLVSWSPIDDITDGTPIFNETESYYDVVATSSLLSDTVSCGIWKKLYPGFPLMTYWVWFQFSMRPKNDMALLTLVHCCTSQYQKKFAWNYKREWKWWYYNWESYFCQTRDKYDVAAMCLLLYRTSSSDSRQKFWMGVPFMISWLGLPVSTYQNFIWRYLHVIITALFSFIWIMSRAVNQSAIYDFIVETPLFNQTGMLYDTGAMLSFQYSLNSFEIWEKVVNSSPIYDFLRETPIHNQSDISHDLYPQIELPFSVDMNIYMTLWARVHNYALQFHVKFL